MSVFAIAATVFIMLSAFGVTNDSFDLFQFGIGLLALHFAIAWVIPIGTRRE